MTLKFTEASRLWNFGCVVFSKFLSLISCITIIIFCRSFSIRNFNLLFTFVFNLYEYFRRFSFSSVSGQVAVAVGFLTRDPSLIRNTDCADNVEVNPLFLNFPLYCTRSQSISNRNSFIDFLSFRMIFKTAKDKMPVCIVHLASLCLVFVVMPKCSQVGR